MYAFYLSCLCVLHLLKHDTLTLLHFQPSAPTRKTVPIVYENTHTRKKRKDWINRRQNTIPIMCFRYTSVTWLLYIWSFSRSPKYYNYCSVWQHKSATIQKYCMAAHKCILDFFPSLLGVCPLVFLMRQSLFWQWQCLYWQWQCLYWQWQCSGTSRAMFKNF